MTIPFKNSFERRNFKHSNPELLPITRADRRPTGFVTRAIRAGLPFGVLALAACTQQYEGTKCGDTESLNTDGETIICDKDGDGFLINSGKGEEDCNDNNPNVHPGAQEICNYMDDDCDGERDEGFISYALDEDGDGFGDEDSEDVFVLCDNDNPDDAYAEALDCDDGDSSINPDALELCDDIDQDCDGAPNEGTADYYLDIDGDGFGTGEPIEGCEIIGAYSALVSGDCDDADPLIYPGASEISDDDIDQDCDGRDLETASPTPEASPTSSPTPQDSPTPDQTSPTPPDSPTPEASPTPDIEDLDQDGYSETEGDCDDADPNVNPDEAEICNDMDDDCDTQTDEGLTLITSYPDADGDGYGKTSSPTTDCAVPSGNVTTSGDCDDSDPNKNPGKAEICDGKDNDCDSAIDEGVKTTWFQDSDSDGYGNSAKTVLACSQPNGYVADNTDCDDKDAAKNPGAVEICDGKDNDCDGSADEEVQALWYLDSDEDGYGDPLKSTLACSRPDGYVADNTDCDDGDDSIYLGASELYDAKDNDCDTLVDCDDIDTGCVLFYEYPTSVPLADGANNDNSSLLYNSDKSTVADPYSSTSQASIISDGGLMCNGGYAKVSVENGSLDLPYAVTVNTNFIHEDSNEGVIIGKWLKDGSFANWLFRIRPSGDSRPNFLFFNSAGVQTEYVCNLKTVVGLEYNITFSISFGEKPICYVDGNQVETELFLGANTGPAPVNDVFTTLCALEFADGSIGKIFKGPIYSVLVFDRVVSAQEASFQTSQ